MLIVLSSSNITSDVGDGRRCPTSSFSAIAEKISKSLLASPGGSTAFLTNPTRRSELVKVPVFSAHIAAGRNTLAYSAESTFSNTSWTTRNSRLLKLFAIRCVSGMDVAGLVAMSQRPLTFPASMSGKMSVIVLPSFVGKNDSSTPQYLAISARCSWFSSCR